MTTIPVVSGYPSFDGRYMGEVVYDKNNYCMYVWIAGDNFAGTVNQWHTVAQNGATGPQGRAGKDADETLINALLTDQEPLRIDNQLQDLVLSGEINQGEFMRLKRMWHSDDDETIKLAIATIKTQHALIFEYQLGDPDTNTDDNEV